LSTIECDAPKQNLIENEAEKAISLQNETGKKQEKKKSAVK